MKRGETIKLLTKSGAACTAAVIIFFASGCKRSFSAAPPTLQPPTQVIIENTDSLTPPDITPTPDSEQEIHFTDINLENVVREKIGKSIGVIVRADVESITSLNARVRGITRIDSLEYFTNLEQLDLYGNRITDFSVLAKLTSLKSLNISKNYNITSGSSTGSGLDITFLKSLLLLEKLDASDNMITDITPVSALTSLNTLTLSRNRITDISPLSMCKELAYVDLSYNYGINADNTERGITDLSPLFACASIKTLIASHNMITRVDGIHALRALTYLDLEENFVDSLDSISKIRNIETLLLHSNGLTSLEPLTGNGTILKLDVSLNMISDFTPIRTMTKLSSLLWDQNNIQDYAPIDEFIAAHP